MLLSHPTPFKFFLHTHIHTLSWLASFSSSGQKRENGKCTNGFLHLNNNVTGWGGINRMGFVDFLFCVKRSFIYFCEGKKIGIQEK